MKPEDGPEARQTMETEREFRERMLGARRKDWEDVEYDPEVPQASKDHYWRLYGEAQRNLKALNGRD